MIESISFKNAVAKATPTNHIIVVDVSYSMYQSLPELRRHMKENIPSIVKSEDTLSVLYFSSRGQFGSVFTGRKISGIADLSEINNLIDRFLVPTGATGFVEPLELAIETAKQLRVDGSINSLIFTTDGYDNCWASSRIVDTAAELPGAFDNITFIEYGWYCNRDLLAKMAEVSGATHVFADGQSEYQLEVEHALESSTPKIRVEFDAKYPHAIFLDSVGVPTILKAQKDDSGAHYVYVPESVSKVWVVSPDMIDQLDQLADDTASYILALYGVHIMDSDLVWAALKSCGDVFLIRKYNNCFTKQDYTTFKSWVALAAHSEKERGQEGFDKSMVPAEDATTVLDVLTILQEKGAKVLTKHPSFSYSRISRQTKQKDDDTEQKIIDEMAEAKTSEERKALAAKMVSHNNWTPEFSPDATDGEVDVTNLVLNSNRPNISIQTIRKGKVLIPEFAQSQYGLPSEIESHIFRNFSIVRDGIINLTYLPVRIDAETVNALEDAGASFTPDHKQEDVYLLNFFDTPLVNRAMVKTINPSEFFRNVVILESLKARQKVMKYYREQLVGKVNAVGLATTYGVEAASFLSEYGIRDYGFSPKTESVESTDTYVTRELNMKVKGVSSLPSVAAVIKKVEGGKKLNAADLLINDSIQEFETYKQQQIELGVTGDDLDNMLKIWINAVAKRSIEQVRAVNKDISKVVYAIVAGHAWFKGMDIDEDTLLIEVDGREYQVTATLEEKNIAI